MPEIDFEGLRWSRKEVVSWPLPDGSEEQIMFLYGVRGLPRSIQGFATYKGNPISPQHNVIGFNEVMTYPDIDEPIEYVQPHEIFHVENKKRPSLMAIKKALGPLGNWFEEYINRLNSDYYYRGKTGRRVNTVDDIEIFGRDNYSSYANGLREISG